MKPTTLREKLHTFIDVLPTTKITEIYSVLLNNYREEFKLAVVPNLPQEEMTSGEIDLLVQQLLG